MPTAIALLEHKKQPFLKALIRSGKVAPATRAVRISRDAVYDWLRADANFRREFEKAKREHFNKETATLAKALDVFIETARPIVPAEMLQLLIAELNIKLTQRQFNEGSSYRSRPASRQRSRLPSFDVLPGANPVDDGSPSLMKGKNEGSALT